jgi:hypothetical protein
VVQEYYIIRVAVNKLVCYLFDKCHSIFCGTVGNYLVMKLVSQVSVTKPVTTSVSFNSHAAVTLRL